jgi:hypothetical protein
MEAVAGVGNASGQETEDVGARKEARKGGRRREGGRYCASIVCR